MISRHLYDDIVRAALREDAPFGDPFGEAFQGGASGLFLAGSDGVLCGGPVAEEVFRQVDPSVSVSFSPDGSRVARGDRRGDPARRPDPVLLDENPVRKGEPVVRPASHPDGVLLEDPEQGRRFPRVEQPRAVPAEK